MNNIIQEAQFIKSIEKWVSDNNSKDLNFVIKNKTKIPTMFKKQDIYFRGMIFSKDDYNSLLDDKNITLKSVSSWTTNVKIATKFISDAKYKLGNKDGIKVILQKKLTPILNIHSYISYMNAVGLLDGFDDLALDSALKEFEVIVEKGKVITKKDILKIV